MALGLVVDDLPLRDLERTARERRRQLGCVEAAERVRVDVPGAQIGGQ
jgi:hypothetical protein